MVTSGSGVPGVEGGVDRHWAEQSLFAIIQRPVRHRSETITFAGMGALRGCVVIKLEFVVFVPN